MKNLIVRQICRIIVPFTQIYGFYIIFHGHLSPGGGFAGGAVVASSFILYSLAHNLEEGAQRLSGRTSAMRERGGALWYLLIGLLGICLGGNFLANKAAGFNIGIPGRLFSSGIIFLLSLGIGAKVASTMVTLFISLSGGDHTGGNH